MSLVVKFKPKRSRRKDQGKKGNIPRGAKRNIKVHRVKRKFFKAPESLIQKIFETATNSQNNIIPNGNIKFSY